MSIEAPRQENTVTVAVTHNDDSWRNLLRQGDNASSQAQHQVQGRLLLDVIIRKGPAVLQLLAREDQALLVRRDALLVLDVVDGVAGFDVKGDRLTRQGLDEDLHAAAQ